MRGALLIFWYLTNRCNDEHRQGPTSHSACFRIHDQFCPWRWFALQISRQRHCPLSDNLLHEREECVLRIFVMYASCIYSWLFFTSGQKDQLTSMVFQRLRTLAICMYRSSALTNGLSLNMYTAKCLHSSWCWNATSSEIHLSSLESIWCEL